MHLYNNVFFIFYFRLQINKIDKTHGGQYSCTNMNGDWANITLRIRPPKLKPENTELLPQAQKLLDTKPKFYKTESLLKDIRLPSGTDLNLPCTATGTPEPKIQFTKDGALITRATGPIYIQQNSLRIQNLNINDSGIYICHACNNHGCINHTTKVEIFEDTPIKRVESLSHVKEAEENDENAFPITSTKKEINKNEIIENENMLENKDDNEPDDSELDDEDYETEYDDGISTNTPIIEKTKQDNGVRDKTSIMMESKPKFANTNKMEQAIHKPSGNTVKFYCKAVGYPEPVVRWTKNNGSIIREIGTVQIKKWTLQLDDLTKSDSGNYTCRACNKLGCIEYTSILNAVGELIFSLILFWQISYLSFTI